MFKIRLLVVLASLLVTNAGAEEIRLATVDYPPYYGSSLTDQGPIAEIATQHHTAILLFNLRRQRRVVPA